MVEVHVSLELAEKLKALAARRGRLPEEVLEDAVRGYERSEMAALDWSHCPAIERVPGKLSGAWVLRGTRMPVALIFENLEAGANLNDIVNWYAGIDRKQLKAVIDFAVRSLDPPAPGR